MGFRWPNLAPSEHSGNLVKLTPETSIAGRDPSETRASMERPSKQALKCFGALAKWSLGAATHGLREYQRRGVELSSSAAEGFTRQLSRNMNHRFWSQAILCMKDRIRCRVDSIREYEMVRVLIVYHLCSETGAE